MVLHCASKKVLHHLLASLHTESGMITYRKVKKTSAFSVLVMLVTAILLAKNRRFCCCRTFIHLRFPQMKSGHRAALKIVILSLRKIQARQAYYLYSRSHHKLQCDKPAIKTHRSVVHARNTTPGSLHSKSNSESESCPYDHRPYHHDFAEPIHEHTGPTCILDRHRFLLAILRYFNAHRLADLQSWVTSGLASQ